MNSLLSKPQTYPLHSRQKTILQTTQNVVFYNPEKQDLLWRYNATIIFQIQTSLPAKKLQANLIGQRRKQNRPRDVSSRPSTCCLEI
jgi:hypothetical protein